MYITRLLFKLGTEPGKESAVFTVPERCADTVVTLYQKSLFSGHQGITKHISIFQTDFSLQILYTI